MIVVAVGDWAVCITMDSNNIVLYISMLQMSVLYVKYLVLGWH